MKSMMVTVMAVIVGLSTGCAQIEYLQNPANYRVNELNGRRMYCHGDQRDNYTPCQGFETPAQIAQKAEQAKIAEANAKNQAIADAKQADLDQLAAFKAEKLRAARVKQQEIADAKARIEEAKQAKIEAAAEKRQNAIDQKKAQEFYAKLAREAKAAEQARRAKMTPTERHIEDIENAQVKSAMRLNEKMRAAEACYRFTGRVC